MDVPKTTHYGATKVTVNKRSPNNKLTSYDQRHIQMNAITEESERHDVEHDEREKYSRRHSNFRNDNKKTIREFGSISIPTYGTLLNKNSPNAAVKNAKEFNVVKKSKRMSIDKPQQPAYKVLNFFTINPIESNSKSWSTPAHK